MPYMGRHTEIIFCDDKSTDETGAEVERLAKLHPERDIRGGVLMVLDGDLAVMPEELPYFLKALLSGAASSSTEIG